MRSRRYALLTLFLVLPLALSGCGVSVTVRAITCGMDVHYVHHSHHAPGMMNVVANGTCSGGYVKKVYIQLSIQKNVSGSWRDAIVGPVAPKVYYGVEPGQSLSHSFNLLCDTGDYRGYVSIGMDTSDGHTTLSIPLGSKVGYSSKFTRDPCREPEQYLNY